MCVGFFGDCAVCQMGISVWATSVGMPPVLSELHQYGILVDATHKQGVTKETTKLIAFLGSLLDLFKVMNSLRFYSGYYNDYKYYFLVYANWFFSYYDCCWLWIMAFKPLY